MGKDGGGNSHQRAMARAAGKIVPTKQSMPDIKKKDNLPRVVELASFAFAAVGGIGVMPFYFWIGALMCELGLLVLLATVWFYDKGWIRGIFTTIAVSALVFMNLDIVFRDASLDFFANSSSDYAAVVGDVPWQPEFTYLRVTLDNDTDFDFTDMDFTLEPNVPIMAISQISAVPGVAFHGDGTKEVVTIGSPKWKEQTISLHQPTIYSTDPDGKRTELPARQLEASQYRIVCDKLSKHSSLDLAIAVARIDRARSSQAIVYWVNEDPKRDHPELTSAFIPTGSSYPVVYIKERPSQVRIVGEYTAHFRPRTFNVSVYVTPQ